MIKFSDLLETDETEVDIKIPKMVHTVKSKTPWADKYRPKKLDDIAYQSEVVKMLKNTLETGNLPHLLFYGPAGTGKTSSVLAICMELFGPKIFKERVIELNASDERGINVVRNKIVRFAKTAVGTKDPNYPCPDYKIIILDEADAMTNEAQSALRKVMEDNSSITRFCFICNYINQIIDPITSRCVKFRFKPLSDESMLDRLKYIMDNEQISISDDALAAVVNMSNGDMRKSIMLLQNLKYIKETVTVDHINELSGAIPANIINLIRKVCMNSKHNSIENITLLTKEIIAQAFPIHNIINVVCKLIINDKKLNDKNKAEIMMHLSLVEKRLNEGANEYLQLLSILVYIKKFC